ncbi:MAG: hypothetical protein MJ118_08540 [Clostridia bacterium]|nr:hypothetical protein [Clostridia bacterium]
MTEVLRTIKNNLDEGETDEFLREAKWIWACIRPYRGVALPHIGLTVLVTVLSLGTGVTTKYLVDSVTGCRVDMLRRAATAAAAKMMRNLMPCGLIQAGVPVTPAPAPFCSGPDAARRRTGVWSGEKIRYKAGRMENDRHSCAYSAGRG